MGVLFGVFVGDYGGFFDQGTIKVQTKEPSRKAIFSAFVAFLVALFV